MDPLANDWLWTCRKCVLTKPCHYNFTVYHVKRFKWYLDTSYHLGIYAKMQASYTMIHRNVYHDSKHKSRGLTVGHGVGGLFANAVLGEASEVLYTTYYGGGRLYEAFIGWLQCQNSDKAETEQLIAFMEASTWHLYLGSY